MQDSASALERARDRLEEEANHLLSLHHGFADAVTLFQVAVALASVAALTHSRPVWWLALALGSTGLVIAIIFWARM